MTPIDSITLFLLILGLAWGTVTLILLRRNKSKPNMRPHILGVGGGVYMFMASMTASILLRPISDLMEYTITNFLLSLALGIVAYFSGRILTRRAQDKD